jgi:hypothetical protein
MEAFFLFLPAAVFVGSIVAFHVLRFSGKQHF